ncbi:MAG TPA: hypothetical protein VKA27_05375 [Sunxiuqinia sp.]|nr:hypothetical protein [Sunxiuqinia sp.]
MDYSKRKWAFFPLIFLAAIAGFSLLVMLVWNAVIPDLFHGPVISYWQALLLLILARILFGGGHFRRPGFSHHTFKDRFKQMTPEEQEVFRTKMQHLRKARWHNHGDSPDETTDSEEKTK